MLDWAILFAQLVDSVLDDNFMAERHSAQQDRRQRITVGDLVSRCLGGRRVLANAFLFPAGTARRERRGKTERQRDDNRDDDHGR